MRLTDIERTVLTVVHEPSILHALRDLESCGFGTEVPIEGGTVPGWQLTAGGTHTVDAEIDDSSQ